MKISNVKIPSIDSAHLERIGEIATHFAILEHTLGEFTRALLGTDQEIGRIITAKLRFKELLELFEDLYSSHQKKDDMLKTLQTFVERAKHVSIKRNEILHSVSIKSITGAPDEITQLKAIRGRRPSFSTQPVRINELEKIRDEINKVVEELFTLITNL